jgi:pSer/pThr/pTyr-binding forkhead associated (FHA) protein
MGSKKLLKVGSADDSDIVVAQQTVSRLHCSLEWTGSAWMIRDLGSTNGTFINGNRIEAPQLLEPSDQVTLGRGIPLQIPSKPVEVSAAVNTRTNVSPTLGVDTSQTNSGSKDQNPLLIVASVIGGAATLLLAGILLFNVTGKKEPIPAPPSPVVSNITPPSSDPIVTPPAPVAPKSNDPKPQLSQSGPLSNSKSPYFAVVIETQDGTDKRLLGTAVAIDSHHVLTLASLLEARKTLESTFPVMRLYQSNETSIDFSAAPKVIHPRFSTAISARRDFDKDLNEHLSMMQKDEEPSIEERLKWSDRFEKIMIDLTKSDFACWSSKEKIPVHLSLVKNAGDSIAASADCSFVGFPGMSQRSIATESIASFLVEGSAKIKKNRSSADPFIEVETPDMLGLPLESLVCVDGKTNIIGLVVREEKSESIGNKQRCQVVVPEVFW